MKVNFTKHLVGVLRDVQDNQSWKYANFVSLIVEQRMRFVWGDNNERSGSRRFRDS
jgi:hypothetical protein